MVESSSKGKKTLWEKEKLHVTSNSSFSHCFQKTVLQTRKNKGLFGKRLTVFQTHPGFTHAVQVLKTLSDKEKLLVTSNFSFSHSVFYPLRELSVIYIKFKIQNYCLQSLSVWKSLKFVIWERVKPQYHFRVLNLGPN